MSFLVSAIVSSAYSQSIDKSKIVTLPLNFSAPEPICSSPAWVLSAAINVGKQNRTTILSQFYPLWQERLVSGKFEQVQSIIIPGGIIDVVNNIIYMENGANNVVVLDIKTGRTIRHINNICCPLAVIDNSLLALSETKADAKFSYDLLMLDGKAPSNKWGTLSLPDWLGLPTDGEREKFIFNAHCYNSVLSVAWQASRRQMFPNPLSLIVLLLV
jgi:hypothetical protein